MNQSVVLDVKDKIATIILNRADTMNAYNLDMAKMLLSITEELNYTDNLKAVLLKGAGAGFMAGGDINYFHQQLEVMPKGVKPIIRMLGDTIKNIRQSKHIYLASVHGAVAGAGMSLMLACDLVISQENTVFSTAYNKLATTPDGGLSYFLPKLVGEKKALELMLFSERLSAKELLSLGLINAFYQEDEYDNAISDWCKKLQILPGHSSAKLKKLVYMSQQPLEQCLEKEAEYFIDSVKTSDFREGVLAFLEKRPPEFK